MLEKWIIIVPYSGMDFEFDPAKSASNLSKHSIDFDQARALWDDPWMLEAPAKTEDEPRFPSMKKSRGSTGRQSGRRKVMRCGSSRSAVPEKRRSSTMKANEFDKKFDAGEDVSAAIDWSQARRPNDQPKRVNVDFPARVVEGLDK